MAKFLSVSLYSPPTWWPKTSVVKRPRAISGTQITILGCGTSSGVPLLACECQTCLSSDPKNKRTRASVLIQTGSRVFLIDSSPDLKDHLLREKIYWIDAVLYSHPHADHLHGIDDLRSLNFLMAQPLPCYGNAWTLDVIKKRFDYIFKNTQAGGGKPMLELFSIEKTKKIKEISVVPLPVIHGKMPVLGYRINDVAYITDCSYIPEHTIKKLKNLDVLVLDCLRTESHPTHLNIDGALSIALQIKARRTYFTHMGHEIEYHAFRKSLPRSMYPAYDGLKIRSSS